MSMIYWVCLIDAVISWQPYAIMVANLTWLVLFGYANGYFDTEEEVEDETKEENVCVIPVDFSHGSSRENHRNGRNRKIM